MYSSFARHASICFNTCDAVRPKNRKILMACRGVRRTTSCSPTTMGASQPKNAASGGKPKKTSAQDPAIGALTDPRAADAHVTERDLLLCPSAAFCFCRRPCCPSTTDLRLLQSVSLAKPLKVVPPFRCSSASHRVPSPLWAHRPSRPPVSHPPSHRLSSIQSRMGPCPFPPLSWTVPSPSTQFNMHLIHSHDKAIKFQFSAAYIPAPCCPTQAPT